MHALGKVNECLLESTADPSTRCKCVQLWTVDEQLWPSPFVVRLWREGRLAVHTRPQTRQDTLQNLLFFLRAWVHVILCAADIFAGEPPPQPVALALADVVRKQGPGRLLTRRWFDRVLDARMADLERSQPETLEDMET